MHFSLMPAQYNVSCRTYFPTGKAGKTDYSVETGITKNEGQSTALGVVDTDTDTDQTKTSQPALNVDFVDVVGGLQEPHSVENTEREVDGFSFAPDLVLALMGELGERALPVEAGYGQNSNVAKQNQDRPESTDVSYLSHSIGRRLWDIVEGCIHTEEGPGREDHSSHYVDCSSF
jgi:hypothetical protein